jgi:hypothetical protein
MSGARDLDWLIPMTIVAAIQVALWAAAWRAGFASAPVFEAHGLLGYTLLAIVGTATFLFRLFQMARSGERNPFARSIEMIRGNASRILIIVLAVQVFTLGSAAFQGLKTGLPSAVPFWMDPYLARGEEWLFGAAPWEFSHRLFGWATPAIDFVYATWLAVQIATFYVLLLLRPSRFKTQALITLSLAWLILGIGGAYLLSSAGPIFYDRVAGGSEFAGLAAALHDAPLALRTSDMLWRAHSLRTNEIASGISAMPSMHVALALWLALILKDTRAAPLGWIYFGLICLGSVHLGWHYASDGIAGALGLLLIWNVAGRSSPHVSSRGVTIGAAD